MNQIFPGVFEQNGKILTKSFAPGTKVYGEKTISVNRVEYREWDAWRSKLGAAIKNGLKAMPVVPNSNILYLGSAEGTTVSHVSDIVGENGIVFGIDVSATVMRKFVSISEARKNIVPILADANNPENYEKELEGFNIDVLFQDVSQKNQSEIFCKNAEKFLPKGKFGLIAIKAKSIAVEKDSKKVFAEEKIKLEKCFNVLQEINLQPFHKEHCLFLCEKK